MPPRVRPNAEHLFSKYDFYGLQEHRGQKMAERLREPRQASNPRGSITIETPRASSVHDIYGRFAVAKEE
jgi:hypothetical protein